MNRDDALKVMDKALAHAKAGELQQALSLIEKAISFLLNNFDANFFYAKVAMMLGKHKLAIESALRAKAINQNRADLDVLIAKLYRELGDEANAAKYRDHALELKQDFLEVDLYLALDFYNSGDPAKAEKILLESYKKYPENTEVVSMLAIVWAYASKHQEARKIIETLPINEKSDLFLLDRYIDILILCKDIERAEQIAKMRFDRVRQEDYSADVRVEALVDMATVCIEKDDLIGAKYYLDEAIKISPYSAVALINMASYLRVIEDYEGSVRVYTKAAELYPSQPQIYHHLNNLLRHMGFFESAKKYGEIALSLRSGNAAYYSNMGATLLSMGELKQGWQYYEVRLQEIQFALAELNLPAWKGGLNEGGRIVVVREQGIGDELLFASLIQDLFGIFEKVSIITHPKLMGLMSRTFPMCEVYSSLDCPLKKIKDSHDLMVMIGSLPSFFRNSIEDFSGKFFQLKLDESRQCFFQSRVAQLPSGLKVGFAWRSILKGIRRDAHYPDLTFWMKLFQIPGVQWICLQTSIQEDEVEILRCALGDRLHLFDDVDHLNNLEDSACLINVCDLIIVPCISTASLAGALNKPTLRLTFAVDEFMLGTDDYPFFPSLVPMMRHSNEGWQDAFERVGAVLEGLAGIA